LFSFGILFLGVVLILYWNSSSLQQLVGLGRNAQDRCSSSSFLKTKEELFQSKTKKTQQSLTFHKLKKKKHF